MIWLFYTFIWSCTCEFVLITLTCLFLKVTNRINPTCFAPISLWCAENGPISPQYENRFKLTLSAAWQTDPFSFYFSIHFEIFFWTTSFRTSQCIPPAPPWGQGNDNSTLNEKVNKNLNFILSRFIFIFSISGAYLLRIPFFTHLVTYLNWGKLNIKKLVIKSWMHSDLICQLFFSIYYSFMPLAWEDENIVKMCIAVVVQTLFTAVWFH